MAEPQSTPFGAGQPGTPPSQNQPEQNRIQPPPPPEVSIRTMGSDVRSLEQGQTKPVPERIFQRPPLAPEASNEPVFRPNMTAPETSATLSPKKGNRGIWIVIGLVVVVGLGALGYFVVYPLLFPAASPVTPTPSPLPSPSPAFLHRSLFSIPASAQTMLKLEPTDRTTILQALGAVAEQGILTGSSQELIIVHTDGSQIRLSSYLPAFGVFSADQLALWFEDDFTAFLFYDDLGVWPGYVFKVKPGMSSEEIKSSLAQLETIPLEPFFLENPGTFGVFRDGNVNGHPNRYAAGEMPGAALEYLIVNDFVILTTSYPAAQEAVHLLGL